MLRLVKYLAAHKLIGFLLSLLLGALAGLGAVYWAESREFDSRQQDLVKAVEKIQFSILRESVDGDVMGAVQVLGLSDENIKKVATDALSSTSESVDRTLQMLTREYQASNAFVANSQGRIVAYYTNKSKSGVGKNIGFRPYFQRAISGVANVYPAVGITSKRR